MLDNINVNANDIILIKYMNVNDDDTSNFEINYIDQTSSRDLIIKTDSIRTFTKIKSIENFNGDSYWEKIDSIEIYDLDENDNFKTATKRVYKSNEYSDSNFIHSKIIDLKNNRKYGFKVKISCKDKNYRKIYMCMNYLNINKFTNYCNNSKHKFGNSLNTQILDWSINGSDLENKCPNILHLMSEGENVWSFKLDIKNILEGNYIFGFLTKFGNFELDTKDKLLGSRLLFTLNISSNDCKKIKLYGRDYENNLELDNKVLIGRVRSKYLEYSINKSIDLNILNKKFYDTFQKIM